MSADLLIYGSYGYAGSLVVEAALDRDLTPILAGRRTAPLESQATAHGLDHRAFGLTHPAVVRDHVEDVAVVLNCAGPFQATAGPLRRACLQSGTDYLDLAGNVDVLEAAAATDRDAERAGVTVLPGVGFDVVATDCLAARLHDALPSGTHLTLALSGLGTFSPGTVKSVIAGLDRPGAIRRDGELRTVPVAWRTREIDFGAGPVPAVSVPWGDVSTAYYTTGIPNVETYAAVPSPAIRAMRATRGLVPLLAAGPVRRLLLALADATVSGPTALDRARSETHVWGEVAEGVADPPDGDRVVGRLRTPDTYDLTAATAAEAARRTIDGEVGPGFQTPASAFGADFVTGFQGVVLEAEPAERVAADEPSDATA